MMLVTPVEEANINRVVKYAEEHQLTMDDFLDRMNNPALSPGIDPHCQCRIPHGFKMVYTIEVAPPGKIRHLSVSVDKKDSLPPMEGIRMLMQIIGFKNTLEGCHVYEEKLEPGYTAINVCELYD